MPPAERVGAAVGHDLAFAVCACGMPFYPDDPNVTHPEHYLCRTCRQEEEEQ